MNTATLLTFILFGGLLALAVYAAIFHMKKHRTYVKAIYHGYHPCRECHGLMYCYDARYDGTNAEFCGPTCPHCKGTGLEP